MVHDGTLYVYTGHDEDKADFFWMQEWRVYSTKDMVNWTDHGSPLAIESFDWADDRAWASQCIERNGKFYWYVCLHSKLTNTMAIGVAVQLRKLYQASVPRCQGNDGDVGRFDARQLHELYQSADRADDDDARRG